jgi:hypothetical protein
MGPSNPLIPHYPLPLPCPSNHSAGPPKPISNVVEWGPKFTFPPPHIILYVFLPLIYDYLMGAIGSVFFGNFFFVVHSSKQIPLKFPKMDLLDNLGNGQIRNGQQWQLICMPESIQSINFLCQFNFFLENICLKIQFQKSFSFGQICWENIYGWHWQPKMSSSGPICWTNPINKISWVRTHKALWICHPSLLMGLWALFFDFPKKCVCVFRVLVYINLPLSLWPQ